MLHSRACTGQPSKRTPLYLADLLLTKRLMLNLLWDEHMDKEKSPEDVLPQCFSVFLVTVRTISLALCSATHI